MSVALQRDIGSLLAGAYGMASVTISADTTQELDPQFGVTIDRLAQSRRYLSCKALGIANVNLTSGVAGGGRSASLWVGLQDSADGNTWADYDGQPGGVGGSTEAAAVIGGQSATASSTGLPTAGTGFVVGFDYDISRARRYIRTRATADLSATSSGTTNGVGLITALIFGGADIVPAT